CRSLPCPAQAGRQTGGSMRETLLAQAPANRRRESPLGDEEGLLLPSIDERLDAIALQQGGELLVGPPSFGPLVLAIDAGRGTLEDQPSNDPRVIERQPQRDPRAHRVTENVRRRGLEAVQ